MQARKMTKLAKDIINAPNSRKLVKSKLCCPKGDQQFYLNKNRYHVALKIVKRME